MTTAYYDRCTKRLVTFLGRPQYAASVLGRHYVTAMSVCLSVCHARGLRENHATYSKSENIVGKLDSSVKVITMVRALHP